MTNIDPLILDFLEWISAEPRSYAEVKEAWRTSCPRLTVWEDAVDRGFVARHSRPGEGVQIRVTKAGETFLQQNGRVISKEPASSSHGGQPGAQG